MPDRKYTAPALEKGLDILDLLAGHGQAMTLSQISVALEKSVGEIFRMIHVLEFKGFIETVPGAEGYALTNRLFQLGMARAPVKTLLEAALPQMRDLAARVDQSCHLAQASREQIVVVARIENPGYYGYSVRTGHRRDIVEATSGMVLYTFQPPSVQAGWREVIFSGVSEADKTAFLANAERVARQGYWCSESDLVPNIIDVSSPIMADGTAIAALTMPYLYKQGVRPVDEIIAEVQSTAVAISREIQGVT
ncbi:transcriptional regulator [Caulobacter sp. AP07]|uniref:IclR family transcriptional regulator n=1 Tax=Caulobacter sp. AP07 TaxID=1144304 RepID=UPI0002721A94|nr:helix-turn-helix domain-containing protein [Caulobacter sp. AP07]EJL37986.1 transcriptional regulator [Caulobacter sp. AP07]